MFSVFRYLEPYFPSASLISKMERNPGEEETAEEIVIRDPLHSETARRLTNVGCWGSLAYYAARGWGPPSLPQPQVAW